MAIRKSATLILGVFLVCLLIGTVVARHARAGISPPTVSGGSDVPHAAVALVKRTTITNTLSIAGEFLPYQEVELHAKVAGYVKQINVDIGDRVREGQVLAVLEIPELQAEVQGAEAEVRHSQEEISRAQQEIKRVESDHAALHAAAQRLQQVSQERPGLVAQQELDDAMAKDSSAEAQVEASKSALLAAEQQLDVSKAANQQYAALSDYSRITAPFSGVVTWRYADTGALVQAGTSNASSMPVVKLAQVNVLRLRIPVPESLAANVRDGDSADIHVQATEEHFTGKVIRSTGALDRSTRSMQVEIDVANNDYHLTPGMYADVSLKIENQLDALTVPVQALSQNGNTTTVLLVDGQNRVQQRQIKTGMQDPDRVQVLGGLAEGDRVIVGNLSAYQTGQQVDPKISSMTDVNYNPGGSQ